MKSLRRKAIPVVIVMSIIVMNSVNCQKIGVDVFKSFIDVTGGVARKLPDSLPSPDAIFSTSKNLIAGYPIEAALSAVHLFCEWIY